MKREMELVIIETLKEVIDNEQAERPEEPGVDTPLFGRNGLLDSLGLVSLVVAVEQVIEDRYGVALSLADEKALSQTHSPYRTVASLAAYAEAIMPRP
jgi:acyl carrier protein